MKNPQEKQDRNVPSRASSLKEGQSEQTTRHWVALDELNPSYWEDPKNQEKRAQEFYEKPVEYFEQLEKSGKSELARRDFLGLMGASLALGSLAMARRPVHKIIPYVIQPEEIIPGVPTHYASTCQACAQSCGVIAKTREGRPIKLEGNPEHPLNRGSLCARGQASLLGLYDPERLQAPLTRDRTKANSARSLTWAEADTAIQSKLSALSHAGGRVRILTGTIQSESTRRLIQDFLKAFKNAEHIEYDPLLPEELLQAQELSFGTAVLPRYAFDQAQLVVSIGSDFLATDPSSLEASRLWAKTRKLTDRAANQSQISQLVAFESIFSLTGANADERYPIRAGDEIKVLMALIHAWLHIQGCIPSGSFISQKSIESMKVWVANSNPGRIAQEIGLDGGAQTILSLAKALWEKRGKSLVLAGGLSSRSQSSLALELAINWVNCFLENEGNTVQGGSNASPFRGGFSQFTQLVSDMKAGQVDALLVYRTNPAYTLSGATTSWQDAVKKVPLVLSIAEHEDETALCADFILPDLHDLESWGDANPRPGIYSLQQPTVAPLYQGRSFQDSLITWIKGEGFTSSGLLARSKTWYEYLRFYWNDYLYKKAAASGTFDQFWESVLRTGVLDLRPNRAFYLEKPRLFRETALAQILNFQLSLQPEGTKESLKLALFLNEALYDGRFANNAWLQELPHPISSVAWDNYLSLSPALAEQLKMKDDELIQLDFKQAGRSVSLELPVVVQVGLNNQTATLALGYGRRAAGKVGDLTGVDAFPLVQDSGGKLVFSGQSVELKKTGKIYRLAKTQWHTLTEKRPIINDITLADYQKNPAFSMHTDPQLRLDPVPSLWPKHDYPTYRWAMAIDLNSCIGCNACMIACQAENNVPIVGRDQVRVSRQMHWIRIDRYYSGSPERPSVLFQPMLCQHCENAPCETVCPVLATVHDDEGLNVQVYNRCVGTRYCQNNCPYKVRRFNFFDHWKSYHDTMNLVWNPDVSVRSRGIMEKCTFCLQRITAAKDHAKDNGEKLRDGAFKTACQQTCPTDAFVFGNLNDPSSQVSQAHRNPRAFRVLEVVNTRPAISYLSKVRNK